MERFDQIKPLWSLGSGPQERSCTQSCAAYDELLRFFEESSDLLCITDFQGRYKRLNPAWQRALGWTLEELRARPFLDFVHPDDRPVTRMEMDRLASGAATVTFENRYCCQDGSDKWLQWIASPLPGRQEIYAIARDVTRQKRLEREIIDTMDRERERMARELHDGLCQNLAGIAALSASLARRLDPLAAAHAESAREIGKLLGQTMRQARDLARGLDPLHLEVVGLATALADFCTNTGALFEIVCTFEHKKGPPPMDAQREIHLYRIAQEAVNNAITHGRARHISVSLACRNGLGSLAIQDDGIGIPEPSECPQGSGLHTMAYRSRLLGAELTLQRRQPQGTVVTCLFPQPLAIPASRTHASKPDRNPSAAQNPDSHRR
ncbi:MAG: PAS domain-containing sensor histidine kinase [Verrucomicrobiota bacterium]